MYSLIFKTILDRVLAFFLLITLFPVLLIAAVSVAFSLRGNPFFVHPRPGLHGVKINVYKLKTMGPELDETGRKRSNGERITPLGNWLRKTSIDEIPQLFCVLAGSISLIGPRPLEMRYLPHYTQEQNRRHEVLPGITGLAQINGRNKLSWEEKFKLDVEYVDNVSFVLDVRILVKTVIQVVRRDGVNASENTTVDPFVK